MGQSTDGILVFGIILDVDEGDTPDFLEGFDDFDDYVDAKLGIPAYGEPGRPPYTEREELAKAFPAELVMHCSYDYPMYIAGVLGTKRVASRGYPEIFTINDFVVDPDRINAFQAWAEENGIEGEPQWILCSMWG